MYFRPQAELLKSLLLATLALVTCGGVAAAQPIAITGGTLIDGNGGQPVANATVVGRDDRIVAVGPAGAVEIPADAKRYDATGKYLLPGFMDMHMHLVYPRDGNKPSDSLSTLRGLHFMELFVRLGMTRMEAITAATKNGAIFLGREAELGTLEPGKLADLQIVDANPLESFQPLGRPSLVMIGGAVVRYQGRR